MKYVIRGLAATIVIILSLPFILISALHYFGGGYAGPEFSIYDNPLGLWMKAVERMLDWLPKFEGEK